MNRVQKKSRPVAVLWGRPEGATSPRHFSAPFIGPPLFKEDVMSFLDFLILYRAKSLVSTSGPLVDGLAFPKG